MSKNKQDERYKRIVGELDSGFDGVSSSEGERWSDSDGKILALRNIIERGTENLEGAELVRKELSNLDRHYSENYFDIQEVWKEYKENPEKDIEKLESGNEADVYILSHKDISHVVKIVQWNAFSYKRNLNQTPVEFLINKTILHNKIFPSTSYKLIGACYRKDKYDENQFNFVFEQKYAEQLLDTDRNVIKATFKEIQEDMERRGFRLKPKSETTYISGHYMVSDLHLGNVLKGKDDKLYYIDPVIRLLNREEYSMLKNAVE